ncbi:zinc finger BED domain-containing protein 4 [Fundulus heteroclitus]|uniref:zinc finger BED domain-containing protein 4 n=1 Tax=Fundulus heteroclitus TaxID=8078 RepID=UPI00165B2A21|nr:zinc finger BED domain-containing protein 4 [Fundulus heteroclitus]
MSAVWDYFILHDEKDDEVECKTCHIRVKRGGKAVRHFNTTNMIKHLAKYHHKEHQEFLKKTDDKKKKGPIQLTLAETFGKRDMLPLNSAKAQGITRVIAEEIILDDEPLSLVSKVGFRRTIQHLEPRYSMPSRHYILEKTIPQIHKDVRSYIEKQVETATALSFTTDIWSCAHRPLSLLSLTAHWIGPDLNPKRAVLHAREFRGSHTANAITAAMEHMLLAWKIDKKRVHVVLRDNAANMKKAMDQLGVPSLGCFAHTLQLVVQHGLLAQRAVSDAIANGRKIVTHFKHSPKAYSKLEDVEEELNVEPKRLQQDVKTRWSSTKMMIDSLVHCKRALQAYASDSDSNLPATLTGNQWSLLEKTATVLKPFQEMTAEVSAASATAADVIPSVRVLTRFLESESEEHRGLQTMKATLLDAVHTRFDYMETEPLYAVATMLDPRYKDK